MNIDEELLSEALKLKAEFCRVAVITNKLGAMPNTEEKLNLTREIKRRAEAFASALEAAFEGAKE